jgi:thioredoxin-related protein
MKKTILALVFLASVASIRAQEIKWMTFDQAVAAQKKVPKAIFMDVYTDWCGPCKMLDKQTFHDKAVVDYVNANFYAVKFNAEGNSEVNYKGQKFTNPQFEAGKQGRNSPHNFGNVLKIQGYPTMIVFNAKGDISKNIVGYRDVSQLMEELKK